MDDLGQALHQLGATTLTPGYYRFRCPLCGQDSAAYDDGMHVWRCNACLHADSATDLIRIATRRPPRPIRRNHPASQDSAEVPIYRNKGILESSGVRRVADVTPEAVSWVWRDRVPLGKLTVVEGDPDQGKSLVLLDLAARLSRGKPMPDGSPSDLTGLVRTLLMTAEDGAADTVRPRLEAAGADLERVHLWESVEIDGERTLPELPRDVEYLRSLVTSLDIKLVVVDVLMAYLGADVKALADQDIRRALRPLAKLAEELDIAIVVIRHLTKGGGANPVYRGGGAIGLGGAARSVMLAGNDPRADGQHLLARVKGNLAAPYPTLAYTIVADGGQPHIRWLGQSPTSATDILAAAEARARDEMDAARPSPERAFLEDELADGERDSNELIAEAKRRGLAYKDLWKASQKLNVRRRKDGFDGGWKWSLPAESSDQDSEDSKISLYRNFAGILGGNGHEGGVPW